MMQSNLALTFSNEEISFFAPPEDITPSEWAARYRTVTEGEHRGPWVNENFAYLIEPMDTWALPHVECVVLNFAPQTGKSQIAMNCLGFAADQAPGPMMYIMPTENKARDFSKGKLADLFTHTSRLHDLVPPASDAWTTFNVALLNSASIKIVWANSPSALSEASIQYLFFDECDKYEEFSGKEADPLTLGEVRTTAYPNTKKIMYLSTPNRESGPITRAMNFKADEIRDFYAVCPACGHPQVMIFEQIKWPKHIKDPRTMRHGDHARYQCDSCKFLWTNYVRNVAVSRGFWRARVSVIRPRCVAYHLPAWYSRNTTLSDTAAAFLEGLQDRAKKMAFVTQYKAEAWKEIVKTTNKVEILKARADLPPQTVPESAIALTCGIDVQKYGFWFSVRAFARDYTSWLIHHGQLATWADVEQLIYERAYPVLNNPCRTMKIWRAGVDTGGGDSSMDVSLTEITYFWLVKNVPLALSRGTNIFGTKGASRSIAGTFKFGEALLKTPSGRKLPDWLRLVSIDTHQMKDNYHFHIQQAIEGNAQGAYLHAGEDAEYRTYIHHILAEEKRKDRKGVEEWVKVSNDNHLFDCEILAMSLAHYQWPSGGVNLYLPLAPAAPQPPPFQYYQRPDMDAYRERLSERLNR
jgi:phage terminase large subunit GpA-like protein